MQKLKNKETEMVKKEINKNLHQWLLATCMFKCNLICVIQHEIKIETFLNKTAFEQEKKNPHWVCILNLILITNSIYNTLTLIYILKF